MLSTGQLRSRLDRKIGERDRTKADLDRARSALKKERRQLKRIQRAQEIVRTVAIETQRQLEYHVSEVVSRAEEAVFDAPYGFTAEFQQRRGRTECDLWFEREGERINPLYSGLGAVDVAAFALRTASWSLSGARTRPVLLLDEPFRHLKGEAQNRRAIELMARVSQELGLQIITISDERAPREDIADGADRLIEVAKSDGASRVRQIS